MAKSSRCPQCKSPVPKGAQHAPFCSGRCRDIDLGGWLTEAYRITRPILPWEMPGPETPERPVPEDEADDDA